MDIKDKLDLYNQAKKDPNQFINISKINNYLVVTPAREGWTIGWNTTLVFPKPDSVYPTKYHFGKLTIFPIDLHNDWSNKDSEGWEFLKELLKETTYLDFNNVLIESIPRDAIALDLDKVLI